ncbi:hypothetical protein NHX12_026696, partial [Muraenolepis orangiensis]
GITKPAVRRLARRSGVKRISGLIYEETRGVLKVFLEDVIRDAVTYTEHGKRKTVTAMDVVFDSLDVITENFTGGQHQENHTTKEIPDCSEGLIVGGPTPTLPFVTASSAFRFFLLPDGLEDSSPITILTSRSSTISCATSFLHNAGYRQWPSTASRAPAGGAPAPATAGGTPTAPPKTVTVAQRGRPDAPTGSTSGGSQWGIYSDRRGHRDIHQGAPATGTAGRHREAPSAATGGSAAATAGTAAATGGSAGRPPRQPLGASAMGTAAATGGSGGGHRGPPRTGHRGQTTGPPPRPPRRLLSTADTTARNYPLVRI